MENAAEDGYQKMKVQYEDTEREIEGDIEILADEEEILEAAELLIELIRKKLPNEIIFKKESIDEVQVIRVVVD